MEAKLVDAIDALLPQTQCTKCGFNGCRPYAEALANNVAEINQCPPGGDAGIHKLSALLKRNYIPLNPVHGVEAPRTVAFIDEALCIGCTLCIQACPVDAIVGAAKLMHTVMPTLCTGCDLCVAPCPVDCIDMIPVSAEELAKDRTAQWRSQHEFHLFRLERKKQEKTARAMATPAVEETAKPAALMSTEDKKALIAAAMARARQQQSAVKPQNTDNLSDNTKAAIDEIEKRRTQK
jgi:electron transport complex protein RnfB